MLVYHRRFDDRRGRLPAIDPRPARARRAAGDDRRGVRRGPAPARGGHRRLVRLARRAPDRRDRRADPARSSRPCAGRGYDEAFSDLDDLSLTHYWDWTGFPVVALPSGVGQPERPAGERLADRRAGDGVGSARLGRGAPGPAGYGLAVIDPAAVTAIDVHVHTELTRDGHDPMPPRAARGGQRGTSRATRPLPTVDDVAAYYRERNLAAVLFTVDWESRSGIAPIPNEEILDAAAQNPDVIVPFVSVDPARPDALDRARELVAAGAKGFKFHPNLQAFFPDDRARLPAVRGDRRGRPAGALPLRAQRDRHRRPGRRRPAAEVLEPDVPRRRCRRLPLAPDRARAPVVPVAGRGDLDLPAQGQRVDRPLRLVAEVLPAAARPVREHPAAEQGAVRLRLPADHARALAGRLRAGALQGRGAAPRPEGERRAPARFRVRARRGRSLRPRRAPSASSARPSAAAASSRSRSRA